MPNFVAVKAARNPRKAVAGGPPRHTQRDRLLERLWL